MKPVLRTRDPPFSGTVNRVNTSCAPTERAAVWNCTARSTTPLRATGSPSIPPKKPSGLITLTCQCSASTAAPRGPVMHTIFPARTPENRRFGLTTSGKAFRAHPDPGGLRQRKMTGPPDTNGGMADTAAPRPPTATAPDLRDEAERSLRSLAGDDAQLREDQWTAISALLDGRRALVVQRTGWGKSAVYFVATALLRARGAGPTVIVSPLLALMRNQIDAARRAGIRARTINSANAEDWEETYGEIAAGDVDVLLVSPERLNNPGFRDRVLPRLAGTAGMLVIDEAHCISDWGHDFRPDYRRLRTLLGSLPDRVPVLATTATANARVTRDVAEQLGAGRDIQTLILRGPLDRDSLRLAVVSLPGAQQRLAWLAEHLGELPGSGIIYTLTVAAARETAAFLRERGYQVVAYTGKDDHSERKAAEDSLLANQLKALVATSALGMGFDKPDLGFVVHLGAPQSPIAYYQQIGRAGRAIDTALVVLL